MPSACWIGEAVAVAGADEVLHDRRAVGVDADRDQRLAPEADRGFEGLAQLVVDVLGEQLQRVAAVVGAREDLRAGEFRLHQIDDAVGRVLVVDADRDQPRLLEAGGAQHVEPRAVAVIDLEAEAAGDLDHVGIEIDGGHVDLLGEQILRHDLPETAEADHQHGGVRAVEVVGLALVAAGDAPQHRLRQGRERRADQQRDRGDRGQQAALRGAQDPEQDAERQQHEGELARAGEHRAGAQRVAALARR